MNQTNKCPKIGIKIHETRNNSTTNNAVNKVSTISRLQAPVNYHTTSLDALDLNIDNYSLKDLYNIFNIPTNELLTEQHLKASKQIVLKMHPDKSRLDAKYFLFFSKAYKQIHGIYEFTNTSTKKTQRVGAEEFYNEDNSRLLDKLFAERTDLKDTKNFNSWFNDNFDKHRVDNPLEHGYEDWLKSDEGVCKIDGNVTKTNMNERFEAQKKKQQALTTYEGVSDSSASIFGGSLLDEGCNNSTAFYTDIKQAYTETLIPVTQEDYEKMEKYNTVSEYQRARDSVAMKPMEKAQAERTLMHQQQQLHQSSAAQAFKYAQDAEKIAKQQDGFWGSIKTITR